MQQQYPPQPDLVVLFRCQRCGYITREQAQPGAWPGEKAHKCPRCSANMMQQGQPQPYPAGPPPPNIPPQYVPPPNMPPQYVPPPAYDTYGSRMKEYRNLAIVGLIMVLLGPIFFIPGWGPFGIVAAISLIFIGGLCALSGFMGFDDEKKKKGIPRIHNLWGWGAQVMGIVSVLSGQVPVVPILLGCIAMAIGKKAYATGDLEGGEIGMICGGMGIVLGIILMAIFWL